MSKKSIPISTLVAIIGFIFTLGIQPVGARTNFVSIGTGGTGGVYYPYGGGVAEIWTKHVKGVKAVAEVTGASVENTKLCDRGETLFGEIMSDVAFQAYTGTGKFDGKPQKIRGMFVMYPNVFHIVTRQDSGLASISDLKGKKVSVGAPGSGTEFMSNLILQESLNIPYSSFDVFRLSFNENANALKDNSIDVGIWCVAPPTSSIMDLATTHAIKVIPFSKEEIDQVTAKFPFYAPYALPANIYKGQDQDVYTASVWNTFICNADLDEELVYKLTKAVFENQEYLMKIHPFAKYTTPENAVKYSAIPLHPGAIRYIREQGVKVSAQLIAQ
ncbi:MAG: TAXI family TRAP transporter solute-binding subunit [Deltaproteobacteria bacterium]|nr:TAXI family TRAP transporter solute-binding subunit [Candidatus Anaeroferrophillus wilburensis]MBN2890206.1 TAXI family TRAP transporter solute-binding subunit [Deltaproteobacteria bacterium]